MHFYDMWEIQVRVELIRLKICRIFLFAFPSGGAAHIFKNPKFDSKKIDFFVKRKGKKGKNQSAFHFFED